MASIHINHLNSIGSDLFADNESYLQELSESQVSVQGGDLTMPMVSIYFRTIDYLTRP